MPDPNVQVETPSASPVIPDTQTPPAQPNAAAPTSPDPATPDAGTPPTDASLTFTDPDPAAPTPPQDQEVVYEKTGDAGLDVALKYVGKQGFGPDHPAMQAATKGDFSKLEEALKARGDKATDYAEYIALAKEAYGRKSAAAKAQSEAAEKVVHDAAGGKDRWAAIKAWAGQHADPDEKAQLNAALKAGGVAAAAAVKYLSDLYAVHGKVQPKTAVKADATGASGNDAPLSAREYAKQLNALHLRLGTKTTSSPEYAALNARRAAARASGQ